MASFLKYFIQLMILLIFIFLLYCGIAECAVSFPGKIWNISQPAQVQMDVSKLKDLTTLIGGNGCVIRHGYLVYTWGKPQERVDVASAAKPWYSYFLFKAVENGKIRSIDERVFDYEKRLLNINPNLGYKDREITWRHLANQTSCYGVNEKPGEAFDYNDWQMSLFYDTLFGKVYGTSYSNVDDLLLHLQLTDIIGCEDNPTFMAFGTGDRSGRLAVSPRDFARFGLLYLRQGNWQGRQLLSHGFAGMAVKNPLPNSIPRTSGMAAEMIPGQRTIGSQIIPDNQCDHSGSYSWLWWINGINRDGKRNWPNAPVDTYGALGHGGEDGMVVIPSQDIIISWNQSKIPGGATYDDAFKLLADTVLDNEDAADRITIDAKHRSWLVRHDGEPFFMCGPGDPEGFLYRGTRNADGIRNGDQISLIRKLACTGANCIYTIAVRSHGGDGDPAQNPFIDNNPAKGLNTKVLGQWDEWFTEMDNTGITNFFIIYDDSANVWKTGDTVSPDESKFITGLITRFKHHRNLVWCIAEEYQEALSPERVRRIAKIIRQTDNYAHPIAVHKNSGLDFAEFAGDPNIDQFTIQYNVQTARELHEGIVKCWKEAAGRYSLNMAEAADFGTGADARRKIWACAMGGAYVMVLGMDIAGTTVSDLEDCGRVVRFMQSVDYADMAPHDELASGNTRYVMSSAKGNYILYSESAGKPLGLKKIRDGQYEFNWYDCAAGRYVIQPHMMIKGGSGSWVKPKGLGNEVALYIRRE